MGKKTEIFRGGSVHPKPPNIPRGGPRTIQAADAPLPGPEEGVSGLLSALVSGASQDADPKISENLVDLLKDVLGRRGERPWCYLRPGRVLRFFVSGLSELTGGSTLLRRRRGRDGDRLYAARRSARKIRKYSVNHFDFFTSNCRQNRTAF